MTRPFRFPDALRVLLAFSFAATLCAQNRPPAIPLIAHNPYFSIWSNTDNLTDSQTRHWTGHPQPLTSAVRVDGKSFRIMGRDPRETPALAQTSVKVAFTHTTYTFAGAGIELELRFFTPAFLEDMDVLSRPVTYLTWTAHATDGGQHQVSVVLDADPEIATSGGGQVVTASRSRTETTEVLSVGTREQAVLNRSGDDLRIDWGYFHIAVPKDEASESAIANGSLRRFLESGLLETADQMEGPVMTGRQSPHLDVAFNLGSVGNAPVARHVLLSYTEGYAIQLMHQNLRPYWQRDNMPVSAMLDTAQRDYAALEQRGTAFDRDLSADLTASAGEKYTALCALAYRQSIAAHVLVADAEGRPMLFAKENFSNGDIATVDVMYPSAPIFLFFNPKLLAAQVLPVMQYTAMPNRWHFPFAPHDLGQYPLANGQEYGGGEKTEENQMPVEESGNLLILMDAISRTEGTAMAERFWPQLTQWAEYLRTHGLDPENQLTTDDFAGHVAHNSNLSIKAIEGVAAYASLAKKLHHDAEAKRFGNASRQMAGQWVNMAREGDHYKLAYTSPGTWSQKYNLVWDRLLSYNIFPDSIRQTEMAFYLGKINQYGLPLDSRADYTKLDWEIWTATLASDRKAFDAMMNPIDRWMNETSSRVPLTDWYDTKTGKQVGFQARSVVGGVFMKALSDPSLTAKWRGRANATLPK